MGSSRAAGGGPGLDGSPGRGTRHLLFLVSYCLIFLMKWVFFKPLCLGDPDMCLVLQGKNQITLSSFETSSGPRSQTPLPLSRGTSHSVFQELERTALGGDSPSVGRQSRASAHTWEGAVLRLRDVLSGVSPPKGSPSHRLGQEPVWGEV